ncbi:MAG: glycosyltransferase family 4 protein [Prochlorococcus marinus CUG1436]|nr:glycosyltransferase family 4 protein [Prochlorococcus marinus CUG1436]
MRNKIKIIHIVPSSFGGGVETAAKSFLNYSCKSFIFKVIFLQNKKFDNPFFAYILSFKIILKKKPDIILTSLWKSNFITLLYKLISPRTRIILFLHSTRNAHFVDKFMTTLAAFFAFEIWADAESTLKERLDRLSFLKYKKIKFQNIRNKRVISLVTEKLEPFNKNIRNPSFIYWGRLAPEKNIDIAIELFYKIFCIDKNASFTIIGPDYGVKESLIFKINKLGLKENIIIYDHMSLKEIIKFANDSCFFIQFSSYEGMGMSVSESMQLGLIPVVTAVGQISSYCKHMQNSLIYSSNDEKTVSEIFSIINSQERYSRIKNNSIKTWQNSNLYKTDIIKAFNQISKSEK